MKTFIKSLATTALVSSFASLAFAGKPLVRTNLDQVYGAGTQAPAPAGNYQVALQPGIYAVGDESKKLNGTHYLIVDKSINDDEKVLAILVQQSAYNSGSRVTGKFMLGKRIKGGTSVMLSPVYIDVYGNLAIESEMSERAAVIEISARTNTQDYRYPYLVQGHNGALGGKLLGMRAKSVQNPGLAPWPSSSVFRGGDKNDNIVISGSTVSIHNSRSMEQRYELIPTNGELGKFAELVETELNTMGEYMTSDSEVRKLAFFMKNNGREIFVVATPSTRVGEYIFEFYGHKSRTFTDVFLPGKLNP